MSYKKILIAGILTGVLLLSPIQNTLAQSGGYGLDTAAKEAGLNKSVAGESTVTDLIGNIVSLVLSFVAIGFFLLVLYAGFKWMFAAGNNEDITKAKGILEAAAIGLIIVLSAYAISSFVFRTLGQGGGGSVTCEQKYENGMCYDECVDGDEDTAPGLCADAGEKCCKGE